MFKALFRKQLMEVNTWLIQDKKKGTKRSLGGMIALAVVYLILFCILGGVFFTVAKSLCAPLISINLGWLYQAMMSLMAILLGVFGSVFNTYATLYKAKDNEFLLSLPVPPANILFVRLFGVWMWSLIYELIVFLPTQIVYWTTASINLLTVLFDVLLIFIVSIFVLSLACILGWLVAKISAKLKNKSIITVLLSILFFIAYYVFYFRANEILRQILANADLVGQKIKGFGYPLYLMGNAGQGDALSFFLIAIIVFALFVIIYWVMSRSFIKMTSAGNAYSKIKYKGTIAKQRSIGSALLFKERSRFTSSPTYMLNCGLGTFLMVIIGIAGVIFKSKILSLFESMHITKNMTAMVAIGILCILASMNDITAPSVSLEGKNLWLMQSLPVSARDVLKSKLKLHLWFTEIPLSICIICFIYIVRPTFILSVFMAVIPLLFVCMSAAFGLAVNLKSPNLRWTDEVVPVKQSLGVMLALLSGSTFVVIMGIAFFLLHKYISILLFLLIAVAVIAAMSIILVNWLMHKGSEIYSSLS